MCACNGGKYAMCVWKGVSMCAWVYGSISVHVGSLGDLQGVWMRYAKYGEGDAKSSVSYLAHSYKKIT